METLIKLRGTVRRQITRDCIEIDRLLAQTNPDGKLLASKLLKLKNYMLRLDSCDEKILDNMLASEAEEEVLDEEFNSVNTYQDRYYQLKIEVESLSERDNLKTHANPLTEKDSNSESVVEVMRSEDREIYRHHEEYSSDCEDKSNMDEKYRGGDYKSSYNGRNRDENQYAGSDNGRGYAENNGGDNQFYSSPDRMNNKRNDGNQEGNYSHKPYGPNGKEFRSPNHDQGGDREYNDGGDGYGYKDKHEYGNYSNKNNDDGYYDHGDSYREKKSPVRKMANAPAERRSVQDHSEEILLVRTKESAETKPVVMGQQAKEDPVNKGIMLRAEANAEAKSVVMEQQVKERHIGRNTDVSFGMKLSVKKLHADETKRMNAAENGSVGKGPDKREDAFVCRIKKYKELIPPNNKDVATRRLQQVTSKLKTSGKYKEYNQIFCEGLIEECTNEEKGGFYLPHRAVFKPQSQTTPLRPVFDDASYRTKRSPSLNDCLEKGPNLLELLPPLILRFRENMIGITADIRKAFQTIQVALKDWDLLRFLWWDDEHEGRLLTYRDTRVVFGVNYNPFLLAIVLEYHLREKTTSPWSERLWKSFYVDNCVLSMNSTEEYQKFKYKAIRIMEAAGTDLRLWHYSNEQTEPKEELLQEEILENGEVIDKLQKTTGSLRKCSLVVEDWVKNVRLKYERYRIRHGPVKRIRFYRTLTDVTKNPNDIGFMTLATLLLGRRLWGIPKSIRCGKQLTEPARFKRTLRRLDLRGEGGRMLNPN